MDKDLEMTTEYTEAEIPKEGFFERKFVPFVGRNWSWLLGVVLTFLFMLLVSIVTGVAPFGQNSFSTIDSMHQYVPFFAEYQQKIRGFESFFYSWDIGMGQNFLSLMMYYISCPLNIIMVFFTRKGIFSAFTFLVIGKMCFSAGAFGYWLSRRRPGKPSNNWLIPAFSVAFSLSNYMIGYNWNVMWLDCIMVLPLIILGMERIFRNESPRMYILALCYALFCNYYIGFMVCVFIAMWFLLHHHHSVGAFFSKGFAFLGYSLLSGGMAAVGLFTAFLGIMQTSSAGKGFPEMSWYGNIFTLLKQHFFLTEPIDTQSFDGGLNAYCGVFAILLFFLFLLCNRISLGERIRKLLIIAFFVVSFNNTVLNFFWHGFHDQYGIPNRFSFLYIFLLLSVGYEALMRVKQMAVWRLVAAAILSLGFFTLCYFFGKPKAILDGKWMAVITFALLTAAFVIILLRQRGKLKLVTSGVILLCLFTTEVMTNAALGIYRIDVANGAFYSEYESDMADAKAHMDEKDEREGTVFSRSDVAITRMLDEATYQGLRSIGTFCSTVDGQLVSTMGRLGCYEGANEFLFYGGNPVLNTLIGLQYTYVHKGDYAGIASYQKPVYENEKVSVYENEKVLPIGYMVGENILEWDPDTNDRYTGINRFAETLSGIAPVYWRQSPVMESSGENCDTWVSKGNDHLVNFRRDGSGKKFTVTGIFRIKESGIHVMDTRQNGARKVKYKRNGVEMGYARFQSQLFDLGYLKEGDKIEIAIEFDADASESGTVSIYDYLLHESNYKRMYDILSEQGLNVTKVRDGSLEGYVTAKEDGVLFTTIPYDKGWTVWVDGEKAEALAAGETFLSVKLTTGRHEIEMHYVSPGFWYGILISAVSWGIFILITVIWRKRRRISDGRQLLFADGKQEEAAERPEEGEEEVADVPEEGEEESAEFPEVSEEELLTEEVGEEPEDDLSQESSVEESQSEEGELSSQDIVEEEEEK